MTAQGAHRLQGENFYCHVYNRGMEGRAVFKDQEDYAVFLGFLQEYLSPTSPEKNKTNFTVNGRSFQGIPHQPKNFFKRVELLAYSLNPNHFHLLLHQITLGSLESFMRSLSTRYSIYFNKKYQRRGSLFEGPYQSVCLQNPEQLQLLSRHLHQETGFSSYPEYLGKRTTNWIVTEHIASPLKQLGVSYQDYVENQNINNDSKTVLKTIVIESELEPVPDSSVLEPKTSFIVNPKPKPKTRTKGVFALSAAFVVLVTLSLRNINLNSSQATQGQSAISTVDDTQQVLSQKDTQEESTPNPSPEPDEYPYQDISPTPTPIPTLTPIQNPAGLKENSLAKYITVNTGNDMTSVNLYRDANIESPILGQANNSDQFELLSVNGDWSQIKSADGSMVFIESKYIVIVHNAL